MAKHKGLTRPVRLLLEGATHRYVEFHQGKALLEAWTGLGHLTTYKPVLDAGLMEWVHGVPPPRHMGWLRLTVAGAEIVQGWLNEESDD